MTGPDTSSIARIVASRGESPCSMWCCDRLDDDDGVVHHDADRQHQAEQREVVELNPAAAMAAKVPMMATGTATSGMIADRQFCRNRSTTMATRMIASRSDLNTSSIDSRMNGRGVVADLVVDARREVLAQLLHLRLDDVGRLEGVGVGQDEDRQADGGLAVEAVG